MPLHFITFSASYKRAKTRQMATPSDQWRPLNDIMDMRNSEHMFVLHLKEMQIKSKFSQVSPKKNHWKSIGQDIKEVQMISITEQRGDCSTVEAISTAWQWLLRGDGCAAQDGAAAQHPHAALGAGTLEWTPQANGRDCKSWLTKPSPRFTLH